MIEFLNSAMLGAVIGVLYDLIAVLRSFLPSKRVITFAFDLLFWIIAIIALFAFVMLYTDGQMRWYFLLGNFFGIFIYKYTISALFFKSIRIIIKVAVKALGILSSPMYRLADKMYQSLKRIKRNRRSKERGKQKEKT